MVLPLNESGRLERLLSVKKRSPFEKSRFPSDSGNTVKESCHHMERFCSERAFHMLSGILVSCQLRLASGLSPSHVLWLLIASQWRDGISNRLSGITDKAVLKMRSDPKFVRLLMFPGSVVNPGLLLT